VRTTPGHSHFYAYIESFPDDHEVLDLEAMHQENMAKLRKQYLYDTNVEESKLILQSAWTRLKSMRVMHVCVFLGDLWEIFLVFIYSAFEPILNGRNMKKKSLFFSFFCILGLNVFQTTCETVSLLHFP
jgi:hypothetical protein